MKRGWRYYRNLLIFALLCLVVAFYIVLPVLTARQALRPARYPLSITPADINQPYEDVTLITNDGIELHGWYIPSQNGAAVIALHAYNGNRSGTIYHADLLADHGYGVLMIDLRAHGQSGGDLFPLGWDAPQDVYAALDYLQVRQDIDPERIGVLGLSIGAETALQAAGRDARIQAVVAEGASYQTYKGWTISPAPPGWILLPGDWVFFKSVELFSGVSSIAPLSEVVPQIAPRALLLISAGEDNPFNRVYFDIAGEPKLYWERPEPGHIDAIFTHSERYAEEVIGFYDRALLGKD